MDTVAGALGLPCPPPQAGRTPEPLPRPHDFPPGVEAACLVYDAYKARAYEVLMRQGSGEKRHAPGRRRASGPAATGETRGAHSSGALAVTSETSQ